MKFKRVYTGWKSKTITQEQAAELLGVSARTVRRYIDRYAQDGSTHKWVPGKMWDLIVTMDYATNEHYFMFFVPEKVTASSFQGVLRNN